MRNFGSRKEDFIPISGGLSYFHEANYEMKKEGVYDSYKFLWDNRFFKDMLNNVAAVAYNWTIIMAVGIPIILGLYKMGYMGP
jgi:hypothetical protein